MGSLRASARFLLACWGLSPGRQAQGARGHFLQLWCGHWFMILMGYTLNFLTNPVLPEIRMRQGHPDYQGRAQPSCS